MMMDKLPYPVLTNVLEVISAANESLDRQLVRQKVLDTLYHTISSEGAIFFLPDEKGLFTYIILKNLDTAYCEYFKTYFYQFDPLQLTHGPDTGRGIDTLEETFSYDSFRTTEYYNDFLKPQKIHHKLIVNLIAEGQFHGRIVLTRPRNSQRFTRNESIAAKSISSYLAHAMAHNELRRKLKMTENLLDYIEKQSSIGIVLLDEDLKVIYKNKKAEEDFDKFKCFWLVDEYKDPISSQLLEDCREIKAGLERCPSGGTMVPRHSVVQGPNHTRFSLISRVIDQEPDWQGPRLLMASVEEQSPANIDPQYLRDKFHLSKREVDVVTLLFSGLKNAQIARKLFVSEVTVKKHLQNIYEKVGVSNRTTLINRVLTG